LRRGEEILGRALGVGARVRLAATAIAVAAVGTAGCGGSSGTAASVPGPAPSSHAGYHWVVPTTGPAPSIAQENSAPGTSAWRMPGPSYEIGGAAGGAISGYVSSQAVAAGGSESIYVSAPGARAITIRVYRMGWYRGAGGRLVLVSRRLPARTQPSCTHRDSTGLTECRWHASLTFPIPSALPSGVYIAALRSSNGAHSDCLFVIRPARPPSLLVQIPTATYEAYNQWGGDSLYPGGKTVGVTGTGQGVEVSYDRPYATQTGAGEFFIRDVALVRFLERNGYEAGYTTSESVASEAHQLEGARALIDVGHSEYWSTGQQESFARALAHGTNLIFISSDTMAWTVRYAPASPASSQAGEPGHRLISYKQYSSLDPDSAHPAGLTALGGAPLVGSAYNGCITPRVPVTGPPVYRYYPWTPAPALQPSWLFSGTGVTASTQIPGIVGYEFDQRTAASPAGTVLLGSGSSSTCGAESEPSPTKGSVAESTLYSAPSGAFVFATGTLGWLYGLYPVPEASPDAPIAPDPRVVAMTRNVLARAQRGTNE
jgi:hypothetical protein